MPTKGEHYEWLLDRLTEARVKGCNLEAAWFAYAVIEDRANSALSKAKVSPGQSLGKKITKLEGLLTTEIAYRQAFSDAAFIPALRAWVTRRNRLMHALASTPQPESVLRIEFAEVAEQGEQLARSFAAPNRRLKKRLRLLLCGRTTRCS